MVPFQTAPLPKDATKIVECGDAAAGGQKIVNVKLVGIHWATMSTTGGRFSVFSPVGSVTDGTVKGVQNSSTSDSLSASAFESALPTVYLNGNTAIQKPRVGLPILPGRGWETTLFERKVGTWCEQYHGPIARLTLFWLNGDSFPPQGCLGHLSGDFRDSQSGKEIP